MSWCAAFGRDDKDPSSVDGKSERRDGASTGSGARGGQQEDREPKLAHHATVGSKVSDYVVVAGQELVIGGHRYLLVLVAYWGRERSSLGERVRFFEVGLTLPSGDETPEAPVDVEGPCV
jgi:hypothetical protein